MAGLLAAGALAAEPSAESAYQAARKSYYALKADPQRRKFRHHWQNVARRFEAVARKYPQSGRAPDALFTAGQLLEDLSQISRLPEDLDGAVGDYKKLLDAHPTHRLADDAALALGRIELDRLGDVAQARQILTAALERYPHADRTADLKSLLASLPATSERAPAPKRIVAAIAKLEREGPAVRPDAGAPLGEPAVPSTVDAQAARERLKAVGKHDPELTLAEQLGLKVRRVVIDAGHGGRDTGAVGRAGTAEKDVTLAIARRLGELLAANGLDVVLTRDDDTFVRLQDRAAMANEAKGDLFISIHCNSAPTHAYRGVETYTLNTSSDRYSIRLAARENASSEKGISDLQFILADLATKANTEESQRLASRVQRNLVGGLKDKYSEIHDLGTKEALFYVLLGTKMPAILVETSFLSNADEEKRLASKSYQEDVARSIAQGVDDFLSHRERVAKVD